MTLNNQFLVFLAKAVFFIVIVMGVDCAVGHGFVVLKDAGLRLNPENMWLKSSYVAEQVDAEILVIGSSKASHHYIPQLIADSLGMTAYNCGQDGCFFLYQNCMVNLVLDRYAPKMILWDIQPGSFTSTLRGTEYQNIRYLSPYYPKNKWVRSYIDSESPKMPYRMRSSMFAYNSKVLNFVFPLMVPWSKTQQGYIPLPNEGYAYPVMNGKEDEKGQDTTSEITSEQANKEVYVSNVLYLELLTATLRRCKEKGVHLQLFISPDYSRKSAIMQAAEQDIQRAALAERIPCWNAHSDSAFMADATLFKDASHLNDKGARQYTERVVEQVRVAWFSAFPDAF